MLRIAVLTASMLWVAGSGIAGAQQVHHEGPSWTSSGISFLRVGTDEQATARLLVDAYMRSRTFRGLVQQIERSNVVVYVFRWFELPTGGGHLAVKAEADGERTIFIFISPDLAPFASIAAIAEQFQHAIEVAGAPEVIDSASLHRFYERLGAPAGPRPYQTAAARDAGAAVLAELQAVEVLEADRDRAQPDPFETDEPYPVGP